MRIAGVGDDVTNGKDPNWLSSFARDALKVDLDPREVCRMHRLGPKPDKSPWDIIVKFNTYQVRDRIYRARTQLAGKDNPNRHIFINEDLSKQRAKLFYIGRNAYKAGKLYSVWTFDGNVFTQLTDKDSEPKILSA